MIYDLAPFRFTKCLLVGVWRRGTDLRRGTGVGSSPGDRAALEVDLLPPAG